MKYIEREINKKNVKMGIGTKETVALEKELGVDMFNRFLVYAVEMSELSNKVENLTDEEAKNIKLPNLPMEYIATVLYHAMKRYNSKLTLDKTYEIIDDIIEESEIGKYELIGIIVELFDNAGFMKGMN